ncbi:UNVERIFIED_CONTAM: hypothetical protein PYX00_002643 [Menopon gallinae]|uniref:MAGE domain-containing protein n=1 Tax=Menopon gallinae TaxID=328185 RepID=A0AAW2HWY3_9NEOP
MTDEDGDSSGEVVDAAAEEAAEIIAKLDSSKKPIKLYDVISLMSEKPSRRHWTAVLDGAEKRLASVGLEVIRVRNSSAKAFFLISKCWPQPFMHKYAARTELADRILLTLVLTYIFMRNGTVLSGDVINHLKMLKLFNDSDDLHQYFGNIKRKILNEFVDQLYLSCSKLSESDMFELSWGPRAEAEVSKLSILQFVCQCGYSGKIRPENLASHYHKASNSVSSQSITCDNSADI